MERKAAVGEVPNIEELTVDQTENSYYRERKRQVKINELELQVDYNGILVQISANNGCPQKIGVGIAQKAHSSCRAMSINYWTLRMHVTM